MEGVKSVIGRVLSLFLCVFLPAKAMSQISADTAFVSSAKKNAYRIYNSSLGDQMNLFNGSEYVERYDYKNPKGFPYFLTDDWIDGTINYDSGVYTNVGLMYDIVTDKVILDMEYSHMRLELISQKIKSFDLSGHHFVRVLKFKNDSTFRSGFYDELYNGKVKVYARRYKERKETAKITGVEVEYVTKNQYYIYFHGAYHRVRARKSVLNLFEDKKKELKKNIRASGNINFRKDREGSLIRVAHLYDELEP